MWSESNGINLMVQHKSENCSKCIILCLGILINQSDVTYKICNPYHPNRFVYFISDPPHLLKTLLSSKNGATTRYLWNDGHPILWNHIADLYYEDLDCNMHLMPKLTHQHNLLSYSKMNVRLAAQVLSSTVSNVIKEFGPREAAGTTQFPDYTFN